MTTSNRPRAERAVRPAAGALGRRAGVALAWVVLLSLGSVLWGPSAALAGDVAVVDTDLLNLRREPGSGGEIVDQMPQGTSVAVLDGPTEDGWYRVRYGDVAGWAYGGYLAIDGVPGWDGGAGGSTGGSGERWIDVDRTSQTVTLYEGDVAIASYWGAMGWDQSDDGFFATAVGTYYVYAKNADLTWTDWAQAYITYWVAFDPARSNGFHAYTMDADGNVLPEGAGPTGGCVALEPWAAAQLFDFAEYGTRVEVHW